MDAVEYFNPYRHLPEREQARLRGFHADRWTKWGVGKYSTVVKEWNPGLRFPVTASDDEVSWFAAHWGVSLNQDWFDMCSEVLRENHRRGPCQNCGCSHRLSVDPFRCDRCFMRDAVERLRDQEQAERHERTRREQREAAKRFFDRLPSGRRQLVEMSGVLFNSPAEMFREVYDE